MQRGSQDWKVLPKELSRSQKSKGVNYIIPPPPPTLGQFPQSAYSSSHSA